MVGEAELKILSAWSVVEELRIEATKFARYGGEDSEGKDGVAEEDRNAAGGFWLKKGLIFGGKDFNFNIAPVEALSSCFPLTIPTSYGMNLNECGLDLTEMCDGGGNSSELMLSR